MAFIKVLKVSASGHKADHSDSADQLKMLSFATANYELTDADLGKLINGVDAADIHHHDARYFRENEFLSSSSGATDAGKPVVLDADGNIDSSMINSADIDHGSLQGLSDDDHTQYLLADGTRNLSGIQSYSAHPTFSVDTEIVDKKYVDDSISSAVAPLATEADVMLLDGTQAMEANMNLGGFKITNIADGVLANDVATVGQVQAAAAGIGLKDAVRVASTANIDLATGGLLTIDGVALSADDRVLVKDQTDPIENGIYLAKAGAWVRSIDMDGDPSNEVRGGNMAFVNEGTLSANTSYIITGTGDKAVDTDPINFTIYSRVENIVAGTGLSRSGTSMAIDFSEFDSDSIIEGSSNLFFTDARAQAAAVSDNAYAIGWDGVTNVAPSKNAVYDKIALIDAVNIASANGSISPSGSIAGDDLNVDVVFSNSGAANRSIEASSLASASNGLGASLVGIEDSGDLYSATNLEAALAEVMQKANAGGFNVATAGEALVKGDLVYMSADNTVSKIPINGAGASEEPVGIIIEDVASSGEAKYVKINQEIDITLASASVGDRVYWTGSAFSLTKPSTSGDYVHRLGIMKDSNTLVIDYYFERII